MATHPDHAQLLALLRVELENLYRYGSGQGFMAAPLARSDDDEVRQCALIVAGVERLLTGDWSRGLEHERELQVYSRPPQDPLFAEARMLLEMSAKFGSGQLDSQALALAFRDAAQGRAGQCIDRLARWLTLKASLVTAGPGALLHLDTTQGADPRHTVCFDVLAAASWMWVGQPKLALNQVSACVELGGNHGVFFWPAVQLVRAAAYELQGMSGAAANILRSEDESSLAAYRDLIPLDTLPLRWRGEGESSQMERPPSLTARLATLSGAEWQALAWHLDGRRADASLNVGALRVLLSRARTKLGIDASDDPGPMLEARRISADVAYVIAETVGHERDVLV